MDNDQSIRIKFVFMTCIVWVFGLGLSIIGGPLTWADYLGWFMGTVLGVFVGYKFGKMVDFEKMQPKEPLKELPQSQKQMKWGWLIPLGVVSGNVVAQYFVPEAGSLITGTIFGFFCAAITYVTLQVVRGRP